MSNETQTEVIEVKRPKEYRAFVETGIKLNNKYPAFVPQLFNESIKILDKAKNPFWKRADHQLFLAYQNGKFVGRIAAIYNKAHNEFHNEQIGHWGFFDSIDDLNVAKKLFQSAERWLIDKNVQQIIGPVNPSTNDECGVLVDSFGEPPKILMTWNPPYYLSLIEQNGYSKIKDLYAWFMLIERQSDAYRTGAEKIKKRLNAEIRIIDLKNFSDEIKLIKNIYNHAWAMNWGFFPMSDEEIDYLALSLKPIVDPNLCHFAFVNGQAVGFSLAIPNYNQAFIRLRNGRLFPFGWAKLLLEIKWKRIDELRLLALGVLPEYRQRGIDVLLYDAVFHSAKNHGYKVGELSWILEDNFVMNQVLSKIGAKHYKTYRLYVKKIR